MSARSSLGSALRSIPWLGMRLWRPYAARRVRGRRADRVTRRNTQGAYERLYRSDALLKDYRSPERQRFYAEVADRIAALRPRSVVDLGCGSGDLLRLVSERLGSDVGLVGIDHAAAGIDRARAALPAARWIRADLRSLDVEATFGADRFDAAVCTEVLEHLDDPDAAVALLSRLCRPGGTVLVTVPDGEQDTWEGHVNFWSETALRDYLAPAGLRAIERIDGGATLLATLDGAG